MNQPDNRVANSRVELTTPTVAAPRDVGTES